MTYTFCFLAGLPSSLSLPMALKLLINVAFSIGDKLRVAVDVTLLQIPEMLQNFLHMSLEPNINAVNLLCLHSLTFKTQFKHRSQILHSLKAQLLSKRTLQQAR